MNNFIFHNNFHRSNHHTIALYGYPESARDPIASIEYPFQGTFYNNIYNINGVFISKTNSYDWWKTNTIVKSNSAIWNRYTTTYTTICSNSANWNKAYSSYLTLYSLSGDLESTYSTLSSNVEYWNAVYDQNTMYTNKVQEYTRQKTFKNFEITAADPMNIVLDLEAGQVSTFLTDNNTNFSDFTGSKKGGIYYLIVITDARVNPTFQISFNSQKFKFKDNENAYNINGGIFLRKFQFLSDGVFLHGKSTLYDASIVFQKLFTFDNKEIVTFGSDDNILLFS